MRLVQRQVGPVLADHTRALMEAIKDPDRVAAKRAFDAMMDMQKIDIATIQKAPSRLSGTGIGQSSIGRQFGHHERGLLL